MQDVYRKDEQGGGAIQPRCAFDSASDSFIHSEMICQSNLGGNQWLRGKKSKK